jgi:hypothetical protein
VLEVDTNGPFKGPRTYDAAGLPLHFDNKSTFKERFRVDKNDPSVLRDGITCSATRSARLCRQGLSAQPKSVPTLARNFAPMATTMQWQSPTTVAKCAI